MDDVRTVKVAMAGCGTVGTAVAEIVVRRADELATRTGLRFDIVRVLVANESKDRDVALDRSVFTSDPAAFGSVDADMVVEVIGGTDTARDVALSALRSGKPLVTANKALLALHGAEVFRTARQFDTCVALEASCAGGLPIVGAILRGLSSNRTDKLFGIFNSTCNYILTEMLGNGVSYASALAEAQRLGYAEADPSLDVAGGDTAHKLTVLASLAFGLNLDFGRVTTEGIEDIDLLDLQIADDLGYSCKLLGLADRACDRVTTSGAGGATSASPGTVALRVHPTLVPKSHALATQSGADSGICVTGDAVGETFYAGAGAGGLPTASAVVADMIDVATGAAGRTFAQLRVFNDQTESARYLDPDDVASAFYVRFKIEPTSKTTGELQQLFKQAAIPVRLIRIIAQHKAAAILTDPLPQARFRAALNELRASSKPAGDATVLHVLTE